MAVSWGKKKKKNRTLLYINCNISNIKFITAQKFIDGVHTSLCFKSGFTSVTSMKGQAILIQRKLIFPVSLRVAHFLSYRQIRIGKIRTCREDVYDKRQNEMYFWAATIRRDIERISIEEEEAVCVTSSFQQLREYTYLSNEILLARSKHSLSICSI